MLRCLPLCLWPRADREAWRAACEPGQRLRRGGRAARLKPVTRRDLERRYGYYLTHLAEIGQLDPAAPAGAQVQPGAVQGFLERGRTIWRPVTLAQSVQKLKRMAQILAPERDHGWLAEIANDLSLGAEPKARFDRIVLSSELVKARLTLVREAERAVHRRRRWRAAQMRSGVMIALLALCPVRLKNFAALTLGTSFCRVGERWWIVLGRGETKGGRADERFVPAELNGAIALYLTWARPVLLGAGAFTIGGVVAGTADPFVSGPLWVGEQGDGLGYSGVERAVMDTTRLALGVALGPHDFRRAAAVTASVQAGPTPHLASALLQHTDVQVTQEHYNRASSLSAAEAYAKLIGGLCR